MILIAKLVKWKRVSLVSQLARFATAVVLKPFFSRLLSAFTLVFLKEYTIRRIRVLRTSSDYYSEVF